MLIDPGSPVEHKDQAFVARYAAFVPQIQGLRPSGLDVFLLFQVQ